MKKALDINEINDKELKKNLDDINNLIEAALKKSNDNINEKLKSLSQEVKKKLKKNKYKNMKNFRNIPFIKINHVQEQNINYVINPVILILASLKPITNFIYAEKTKEILKIIGNQNFILYFNALLKDMRDDRVMNPDYSLIHQYFKIPNPNLKINYLCLNPGSWINQILMLLESNINIVKLNNINNIENIITKKFRSFFCQIEECDQCGFKDKIPKENNSLVINIILNSAEQYSDELSNNFNALVLGERIINPSKYCQRCEYNLTIYKLFDKTSKYLIINIERKNNNKMTLTFEQNLKIFDNTDNKEYEYELISALTIIDIDSIILFIKDFNNQWNKLAQGLPQKININENVKREISKQNPNILIYKKILKK